MTSMSASHAKTHFGALMDKAQKEPVTIEKQGRPVAVVISFDDYQEQYGQVPTKKEKEEALSFLKTWGERPAISGTQEALKNDPKAHAIWDKYTREG